MVQNDLKNFNWFSQLKKSFFDNRQKIVKRGSFSQNKNVLKNWKWSNDQFKILQVEQVIKQPN